MNLLQEKMQGRGGVIAIDKQGNIGKAFNTDVMPWASIKNNQLTFGLNDTQGTTTWLHEESRRLDGNQ